MCLPMPPVGRGDGEDGDQLLGLLETSVLDTHVILEADLETTEAPLRHPLSPSFSLFLFSPSYIWGIYPK